MQRSKLEYYEDIVTALAQKALTLDGLAYECNMDCVHLEPRLQFLINNDLVSIEISKNNHAYYVLTRRGLSISKTFRQAKRLEKLKTPQQTLSQTLQFAVLPQQKHGKAQQ